MAWIVVLVFAGCFPLALLPRSSFRSQVSKVVVLRVKQCSCSLPRVHPPRPLCRLRVRGRRQLHEHGDCCVWKMHRALVASAGVVCSGGPLIRHGRFLPDATPGAGGEATGGLYGVRTLAARGILPVCGNPTPSLLCRGGACLPYPRRGDLVF